jgi:excisionase family DNA binding protein
VPPTTRRCPIPGPAVRCPACGHALVPVDEPAWPVRAAPPGPAAPAAPEGPLLLTVTRAAGLLGVSRSTLYQLVAAGRVPVVRLGRAVRVPRRGLERVAEAGFRS